MLELAFQSWFVRFRPFTTFHLVVVAICAALVIGATCLGRSWRARSGDSGAGREHLMRQAWGWSILASQAFAVIWRAAPERFTLEDGLPLHLCRIAGWVAGFAMIWQWRWARTLTYFWGLGLCAQGFVTPLRLEGLRSLEFWLFWTVHLQIVGTAIYDVAVLRYRPSLRDWWLAAAVSTIYAAFMIGLNVILETDYGWLGQGKSAARELGVLGEGRYRTRNVIDHLGDWPERPLLLIVIGHVVLASLYAVWRMPWPGGASAVLASEPPQHSVTGDVPQREPIEAGAT